MTNLEQRGQVLAIRYSGQKQPVIKDLTIYTFCEPKCINYIMLINGYLYNKNNN